MGPLTNNHIRLHTQYDRPAKREYKLRVAIAGDVHAPYAKEAYLKEFYKECKAVKPHVIVQIGDCYDLHNFATKYLPDPNIRPDFELVEGRKQMEQFWKSCQKAAPRARCIQILGNHDLRILKYIWAGGRTMSALAARYSDFRDLWAFDGVEPAKSARDIYEIDGNLYTHGWLMGVPGKHASRFGRSAVVGHTHEQGIVPVQMWDGLRWEMNVGVLGDENAPCFSYNASIFVDATPGFGIVDHNGPRLVTL